MVTWEAIWFIKCKSRFKSNPAASTLQPFCCNLFALRYLGRKLYIIYWSSVECYNEDTSTTTSDTAFQTQITHCVKCAYSHVRFGSFIDHLHSGLHNSFSHSAPLAKKNSPRLFMIWNICHFPQPLFQGEQSWVF